MIRNKAFRWILLALGLFAIIALTGMNVYSLYDIRDRIAEGEEKRQISLLEEQVRVIRTQIYAPFQGLRTLELEPTEYTIPSTGKFPPQMHEKIVNAAESPIFDSIYYTPEHIDPCVEGSQTYAYNYSTNTLDLTDEYSSLVCDGVGLARTKARIELNSFDYRWNTNTEFDAHRTMNIGFINLQENRVIGYLTLTLNREFIVDDIIAPILVSNFNPKTTSETVVWLHDWANDEVLATNNPDVNYDIDLVSKRVSFGGINNMFENWNIKVGFLDNHVASMYNETLFKNLTVLGVAVLLLMGALLFMFYTAQRERALSQRQAGFLANVTHELKTPLAVMQAAGENISDGRVTDPVRLKRYGDHIYSESIRLRKTIEKLLDVAKSDSGQALIKAIPENLNQLIKGYIQENRSYIEEKGFRLSLKNSSGSDHLVLLDRDNIETIFSNLTENAIKYSSDKKSIQYSIESDGKFMTIHVSDLGIGIPRKHLKNVFKKFFRVEDSLNAKTKGHGLGLSIVQNLVELNGGSIDVKSELGKGTTFSLKFPIFMKEEKTLIEQKNRITFSKNITEPSEYA